MLADECFTCSIDVIFHRKSRRAREGISCSNCNIVIEPKVMATAGILLQRT